MVIVDAAEDVCNRLPACLLHDDERVDGEGKDKEYYCNVGNNGKGKVEALVATNRGILDKN